MTITKAMMDANEERLRRDYPGTEITITVEKSEIMAWKSKLEVLSEILNTQELSEKQQDTLGLILNGIVDQMNVIIGDEND